MHSQYDDVYGLNGSADRFNNYGFDAANRAGVTPSPVANPLGSTTLYPQNVPRYGLGGIAPRPGSDGKMNGLHGPKHKRGDMDRECKFPFLDLCVLFSFLC